MYGEYPNLAQGYDVLSMKPSNTNTEPTQAEIWSALAGKAQKGDKAAYNKLLSEIHPFIKRTVIGTLANPDWADDLTQEIMLSIHKALKTYDPERSFKPWMMAIVYFRRTDFLRSYYNKRGNVTSSFDELSFEKEFVTNPTHAGEYKDIEKALNSLSDKQRQVFVKMRIEGYTAKEVAKEMGMSVSAVKVSAHRTLKKVKEQLK